MIFGSEERAVWLLVVIAVLVVVIEGGSPAFAFLIVLAGGGVEKLIRIHDVLVEIRDQNEETIWERIEEKGRADGEKG